MPQNGGHADEINIFMNIVEYFPLRLTCEVQFRVFGTGFLSKIMFCPHQSKISWIKSIGTCYILCIRKFFRKFYLPIEKKRQIHKFHPL